MQDRFLPVPIDNIMITKNHNDFNPILNQDMYQAFVQTIDLLSLHCPLCGVVGLFIFYGHYKRWIFTEDFDHDCKVQLKIQRVQCKNCKSVHALLPDSFVPYSQLTFLLAYYICTLDEEDELIRCYELSIRTVRKIKSRILEFWNSLFPQWRNCHQSVLKCISLKKFSILFGSTHKYRSLYVLPTEPGL